MRRLIAALAAVASFVATAPAARADAGGGAFTDDAGIHHEASSDSGSSGGGSGSVGRCTYTRVPISGDAPMYDVDGTLIEADGTGYWYEKSCDGEGYHGLVYISHRDPAELVAEAHRYLELPPPEPRTNPGGDQLVNLPTWLWLASPWEARSSSVSVPGVRVTVRAVPEVAVWSMGDDAVVLCAGPGTPYDPAGPEAAQQPACSHTYRRSSASQPGLAYRVSVTVRWRASWSVAGFAGGGDLGPIERTTTFALRVGEVQAINTAREGGHP